MTARFPSIHAERALIERPQRSKHPPCLFRLVGGLGHDVELRNEQFVQAPDFLPALCFFLRAAGVQERTHRFLKRPFQPIDLGHLESYIELSNHTDSPAASICGRETPILHSSHCGFIQSIAEAIEDADNPEVSIDV